MVSDKEHIRGCILFTFQLKESTAAEITCCAFAVRWRGDVLQKLGFRGGNFNFKNGERRGQSQRSNFSSNKRGICHTTRNYSTSHVRLSKIGKIYFFVKSKRLICISDKSHIPTYTCVPCAIIWDTFVFLNRTNCTRSRVRESGVFSRGSLRDASW